MASAMVAVEVERPSLALDLPDGTSFDQWVAVGRRLCLTEKALNWHIGDWWAFGDHRYGERAKAAAEGIFGLEYGTLANMASVCRRFEPSRRRETLTFRHHTEVAALKPTEADDLLEKAERDHLSANLLRREVQALRADNDTDEQALPESKSVPRRTDMAELAEAYEKVVELGEALEREMVAPRAVRKLTEREARLLMDARDCVCELRAGQRPCPDDFDIIFVEKGRLECEAFYRASRRCVDRWLVERGKRRLIEERAAYLKSQRDFEHPRPEPEVPIAASDDPQLPLASMAADYLRTSRYGGWTITRSPGGGWRVGTVHRTSEELISMAERQGFDRVVALQETGGEAVERSP